MKRKAAAMLWFVGAVALMLLFVAVVVDHIMKNYSP